MQLAVIRFKNDGHQDGTSQPTISWTSVLNSMTLPQGLQLKVNVIIMARGPASLEPDLWTFGLEARFQMRFNEYFSDKFVIAEQS
ncbi:MAG: hypothetical protein ABJ251_16815 [Paracoccaceae bacterium]